MLIVLKKILKLIMGKVKPNLLFVDLYSEDLKKQERTKDV